MQRFLIIVGITALILALFWPYLDKLHIGRLPGDIVMKRPGFSFYFPITTSILISLIVSLLLWIFKR